MEKVIKKVIKEVTIGGCIINPLGVPDWKPEPNFQELTDEKIIGLSNLMSIAWLNRGLELARSVARIITPEGLGTGFLIGPDLLMTNNHVIENANIAAKSIAEFNYQKDWSGRIQPTRRYPLDSSHFKTEPKLDYTIVRVHDNPGDLFGYFDLSLRRDPSVNDYVSIIQHPSGGPKQIALTDNKVAAVFDNVVQYTTDTEPGSSGSAVFEQDWRLVGLHHAGGMLQGPERRKWFINEGILINRIIQDARVFLGLPDALYDVSFGELRTEILRLIHKGGTPEEIRFLAGDLSFRYPRFGLALYDWVQMNRNKDEVAPLLAAAAGVATGAAIRHWARSSGHEAIEAVATPRPFPSDELFDLMHPYRGSEKLSSQVYDGVLSSVRKNMPLVQSVVDTLGTDGEVALPVLAAAFLAGVAVGAKAYDGK